MRTRPGPDVADPGAVHRAVRRSRPGERASRRTPTAGTRAPLYEDYRATGNYVSDDGRVVLLDVGLAAGDPETTGAMNAIPGDPRGYRKFTWTAPSGRRYTVGPDTRPV